MISANASDGSRLLISGRAVRHNVSVIANAVGPQVRICAVVKADGYGHSAKLVTKALAAPRHCRPRVNSIAVACLDEAIALEPNGLPIQIFRPIEAILFGPNRTAIEMAIRSGWILTVCEIGVLRDLARTAKSCGAPARVQVMLDTGMSRSGAKLETFGEVVECILEDPWLDLVGIATHFACADERASDFTLTQLNTFRQATESSIVCNLLSRRRIIRHAANSAAIFNWPQTHLDMVRPGIALYGIDPTSGLGYRRPLRPAMRWTAPLILVKQIRQGDGIGYNLTYRAPKDMLIGLVPIGYADGYCRSLSNRAVMRLGQRNVPVVGRISMDLTTVDLSECPHATTGEALTVLDDDPASPCSVHSLARLANTIPYEILSRIGSRVRRVMVDETASESADPPLQAGPATTQSMNKDRARQENS